MNSGEIEVKEATLKDVQSLTTIVARSFHPVNPFIKRVLPDTALVRDWWSRIFEDEINDADCHVITAIDPNAPESARTAGILTMRQFDSAGRGAGFWTMYPFTSDQDLPLFQPAIDLMVKYREEIFLGKGRTHYLIELFGVDHKTKGSGIGKLILRRACEIADQQGVEVFVEANAAASGFYAKMGFVKVGDAILPGEIPYHEFLMVRPSSNRGEAH